MYLKFSWLAAFRGFEKSVRFAHPFYAKKWHWQTVLLCIWTAIKRILLFWNKKDIPTQKSWLTELMDTLHLERIRFFINNKLKAFEKTLRPLGDSKINVLLISVFLLFICLFLFLLMSFLIFWFYLKKKHSNKNLVDCYFEIKLHYKKIFEREQLIQKSKSNHYLILTKDCNCKLEMPPSQINKSFIFILKRRSYFWWLVSELYTISYLLIVWSLSFHFEACMCLVFFML